MPSPIIIRGSPKLYSIVLHLLFCTSYDFFIPARYVYLRNKFYLSEFMSYPDVMVQIHGDGLQRNLCALGPSLEFCISHLHLTNSQSTYIVVAPTRGWDGGKEVEIGPNPEGPDQKISFECIGVLGTSLGS